jgi:hypothetical protein
MGTCSAARIRGPDRIIRTSKSLSPYRCSNWLHYQVAPVPGALPRRGRLDDESLANSNRRCEADVRREAYFSAGAFLDSSRNVLKDSQRKPPRMSTAAMYAATR